MIQKQHLNHENYLHMNRESYIDFLQQFSAAKITSLSLCT